MEAGGRINKFKEYLSTAEVCRGASVTRGQLRLYEREGLLVPPIRSSSGYRKYPFEVLNRLKAIQGLKELGLTLGEIAEILSERDFFGLDEVRLQQKAREILLKTDLRIARLQVIKTYIERCISGGKAVANDPDCKFMTEFLCAVPAGKG